MLGGSYEGDPLSPQEGEAVCGEHPRAPSFVGFQQNMNIKKNFIICLIC